MKAMESKAIMSELIAHGFEEARLRQIKDGNSGLPEGAVKCEDREVAQLLQEMWVEKIRAYFNRHYSSGSAFSLAGYKVEESSADSPTFSGELHPRVEGYIWYRGIAIEVENGKVILFFGWMQPWLEGGAPDPICYTVDNPSRASVLQAIRAY
jgi:hypothetical protein